MANDSAHDRYIKDIEARLVQPGGDYKLTVNKGTAPEAPTGGLSTGVEQQVKHIEDNLVHPGGDYTLKVNGANTSKVADAGLVVRHPDADRDTDPLVARTEVVRFDAPVAVDPDKPGSGVVMSGVRVEPAKPAAKTTPAAAGR